MFGTILAVILTVIVVGGASGAAMYRVLDRSNPSRTTEDGAVVEPIYGSATPAPTIEPSDDPASQGSSRQQPTPDPTVIVVPGHTETPQATPDETAELDEEIHDTPPPEDTPDDFSDMELTRRLTRR